jgi:Gas vesicle protein G
VGVIKEMALLPVAPLRLTVWVADKVAEQVDREQNSPQARVRRLREIEDARARGELDEEQAAELEARVLEQAGAWAGYRG